MPQDFVDVRAENGRSRIFSSNQATLVFPCTSPFVAFQPTPGRLSYSGRVSCSFLAALLSCGELPRFFRMQASRQPAHGDVLRSRHPNQPTVRRVADLKEHVAELKKHNRTLTDKQVNRRKSYLTVPEAMRNHMRELTAYEQSEILDYTKIYFVGAPGANKIQGVPQAPQNAGYDDENGDYIVRRGDHISYRYELLKTLGKGAFGRVLLARDHATGNNVALKIIRNRKRFFKQAAVEIKILEHCNRENAPRVVTMLDHNVWRNHVYISFELLGENLYQRLKAAQFIGMPEAQIQNIAAQLVHALAFCERHKIIHCDVKPENILICPDDPHNIDAVKLIDFGSSCYETQRIYTYVQSRFYRSPEVLLGASYLCSADMWSLGCVLVELLSGYPLFPGEDEHDQMSCIMEVFGEPPQSLLARANRTKNYFEQDGTPKVKPNRRGKIRTPGTRALISSMPTASAEFVDFVAECLHWEPRRRLTATQALSHPWILEAQCADEDESSHRRNRMVDESDDELEHRLPAYQHTFNIPGTATANTGGASSHFKQPYHPVSDADTTRYGYPWANGS
ncbi:MAG: hypothetical protein MHM6MM_003727 [Cercozoa sp. M6MM]